MNRCDARPGRWVLGIWSKNARWSRLPRLSWAAPAPFQLSLLRGKSYFPSFPQGGFKEPSRAFGGRPKDPLIA